MKEISSLEEIPDFKSEEEEAEFWATHSLGDEILDKMGPVPEDELPPVRPRTRPISLRFDDDTLKRLRLLAEKKHKGYQTLLKEFVAERLYEEEKREGIISTR
ncbi:MAG: CopG family antitoxin [Rubrobacter sp.]